ncbi:hypothetical protein ABZS52_18325 [Micromonospora profundi]|uniref:hypothetical protein n=1 Tax=Micromonospora profundi TaxID=1420889 RepID=UPI0033B3FAD8
MTIRISAGSPAHPRDRRTARAARELLTDELTRVRAGAVAWRNGLGALLAGLIGFGLLKGRSDVTQLAPPAAATVGALLLGALSAGAVGAVLVMRAAHGRPYAVSLRTVLVTGADDPTLAGRMREADLSQRALSRGVVLTLVCVVFLAAAVGLTWYGPAKDKPRLEVRPVQGGTQCGEVVSVSAGQLVLKTPQGRLTIDLTQVNGLAAVDSCSAATGQK